MSIRPVDRTTMIPNTQRMSDQRLSELSKGEHITQGIHKDVDKEVLEKQQKVQDMEETVHKKVKDDEPRDRNQQLYERERDNDGEPKGKKKKANKARGNKLDIRI